MFVHQPLQASRRPATRLAATTGPRPRLLALLVGAALVQLAAPTARADSGSGVDTWLGNALNPAGVDTSGARDPDGLGEAANQRSPTGFLQASPSGLRPPQAGTGWWVRGSVEAGGLAVSGDKEAQRFTEYKSLKSGLYLNTFQLEAENAGSGQFVELRGGGLARDDQYFGLSAGRHNSWRLKAFYNEINHVYTSTYRNLWSGTGTGRLTLASLPAGPLAPATAATTDIAIGNAALATPYSTLSVLRQRGGLRLDLKLAEELKAYASFTSEKRQGARPFGMVSGGGGGTGGVEIPESIDYDTHDVAIGLQWASDRTSANLQASASLFRNNIGTMTVDNPMFLPAANGIANFPQARYDLYPNNDFFNLKAEVAHSIPEWWRLRLTGVFSAASSRQNDELIPSTPYAGAVVNGISGGAWDTTASLSRPRAGARIDSQLVDLGLVMNPLNELQLKAKWRRYATDNSTEYWACNPITGQWGRLLNDGSGGAFVTSNATAGVNPTGTTATAYDAAKCNIAAIEAMHLVPSAGNINIRNIPYEQTTNTASSGADWQFARGQNLNLALERESIDRQHRERATTDEDRIKLGYVNRSLSIGTLRLSAEHDRRRGSTYVPDPYDEFYSGSMGPLPTLTGTNMTSWIHVDDLHRKFDLADRDQSVLNGRLNMALLPELDLALSGQLKEQRYPGVQYGRRGVQRQNTLGADLNWQPSPDTQVWAYVSQQDSRMQQAGVQQNACTLGATYYLFSDGSMATSATPTAAQLAAGITVVGNSGVITAANFLGVCGTASPTSPLYPSSRTWTANQSDHNTTGGLGLRHDFGPVRGEVNLTSTRARTALTYTYSAAALGITTSGAPTAAQLTAVGLIGNAMPDVIIRTNVVDGSVVVPVNKSLGVRLLLRHEQGKVIDWHYQGVAENPTPSNNQQTYLDSGPQAYTVNMVGVMLQFAF